MIVASTVVALPLLAIALVARRFRSDLEEAAWRLMAVAMLATPFASLLPKIDIGMSLPWLTAEYPGLELPTDDTPAVFVLGAILYAIVAIALLARLAVAAMAAWRLRRNAEPFGGAYVSASLRVPVTAGLVAPAILLPPDARTWSEAKLEAILAHERAHVVRRDPLWRFIGRAAAAVCWLHPLAWLAARSIERIAEETADREAVAAIGDRHQYANVILELLRAMTDNSMTGSSRRVLAAGMLDGRTLGARIDAILQPARTRPSPFAAQILLVTIAAGSIFTAAMTKYEAPPEVAAIEQRQPTAAELEFFRKRDELRRQFRKEMRRTMRTLFGSFVD